MSLLDRFFGLPQLLANGLALATRAKINFVGGSVTDDAANDQTIVNLGSGGGGGASLSDAVPDSIDANTGAPGNATQASRANHRHRVLVGDPVELTDSSNAQGSGTSLARANHQHAHGQRGGGNLHAVATSGAPGFMSTAHVDQLAANTTKLNGIADGANAVTSGAPIAVGGTGQALDAGSGSTYALANHRHTLATADRTALDVTLPSKADRDITLNPQTGTAYTLAVSDDGRMVTTNNAAANAVSLPSDATAALPIGSTATIVQLGAGATTVQAGSGATLIGGSVTLSQNGLVTVVKVAANTWLGAAPPVTVTISTATPTSIDGNGTANGGTTAAGAAARDHKHAVTTGAPIAIKASGAVAAGSGAALALANHEHVLDPADRTKLDTTLPGLVTTVAGLAPRAFEVIDNAAASLTLNATHLGKLIRCALAASTQRIVIPRDSTLNLPIGFTVTVVYGVTGEGAVYIDSEVASGALGIPARYSRSYTQTSTTPYQLAGTPFAPITLTKLAADQWVITGVPNPGV